MGNGKGSEACPLLPTPDLAVDSRGKGAVRAGEQWVSCEARGRGPARQGTGLGRPEEQHVIAGEEPQPLSVDEAEMELLRQFDLAWQYGPCTGESTLRPREHIPEPVLPPTRHPSSPSPCLTLSALSLENRGVEVLTHPSTHTL